MKLPEVTETAPASTRQPSTMNAAFRCEESHVRGPPPPIPYHTKPILNSYRNEELQVQSHGAQSDVIDEVPSTRGSLSDSSTLTTLADETGGGLTPISNPGRSDSNSDEEYWRNVNELSEESLNSLFSTMTVSGDHHEVHSPESRSLGARPVSGNHHVVHGIETPFNLSISNPSSSHHAGTSSRSLGARPVSGNRHVVHGIETSFNLSISNPSSLHHADTSRSLGVHPAMSKGRKKKYYCVTRGRRIGIFNSWIVTKPYVTGIDAVFQAFNSLEEALEMYDQARELGSLEVIGN